MTFDAYASRYRETVNASIGASGEDSEYFAELKARLAQRFLAAHPPREVLDFGCGVGLLSRALLTLWPQARVTGFDTSAESIEQAQRTLPERTRFVHGTGNDLPFAAGEFDAIVAACVFHHIDRAEHAAWLTELHRVLRPGGTLLVFEHNPLNPLTRRAVACCPFDEGVILLSPRYLRPLLRRTGYRSARTSYYFFFPRLLAWLRPLEPLLARVPLGAQFCVQAVA